MRDDGSIDATEIKGRSGTYVSDRSNLTGSLDRRHPANECEIQLLTDTTRKDFNDFASSSG